MGKTIGKVYEGTAGKDPVKETKSEKIITNVYEGTMSGETASKLNAVRLKPLLEAAGALGVSPIPKTDYSKPEYDYTTGRMKTAQQKFADNLSKNMSPDNYTKYLQTEIQKKTKEVETAQAEAKSKEDKLKTEYKNLKKIYEGGIALSNGINDIDRSDPQAYDNLTDQNTAYAKQYGYNSLGELEAAYKAKKAEYEKQKQLNYYSSLPSGNYDKAVKDDLYVYINNDLKDIKDTRNYLVAVNSKSVWGKYKNMTEREIGIYNYLYNTEGDAAATEFLEYIDESLMTKQHIKSLEKADEFANKNLFTAGVASVLSVPIQLGSAVEQVGHTVEYLFTGELERSKTSDFAAILRQGMTNQVDAEIGNWDVFDFVYNTTMSGVDSLVVSPLGPAGGIVLAFSAAANATNDIISRGGTVKQAFWGGLASGLFEGMFEAISLGKLSAFKEITETTWKEGLRNFVSSVVVNGSEEGATEVANILWDTFVNKDISNYKDIYDKYYNDAIGSGLSAKEARKQAKSKSNWQMVSQVVEAIGSGALMGGGFALLGKAMSTKNAVNVGKIIAENKAQNNIIELGLSMDDLSDSYKMAVKIQNSGKMTNTLLGKLAVQILNDVADQKNNTVANAVVEYAAKLQIGETEAKSVATYFGKAISQQSISDKEYNAIKNSSFAKLVAKELQTDAEWVNNMKAELSTIESVEKQVREAITLNESPNPVLQSSANEGNVHPVGTNGTNIGTSDNVSGINDTFSGTVAAGVDTDISNIAENKNTADNSGKKRFSLIGYSKKQIENWKNSKSIIIYENEEQLRQFIRDAVKGVNLDKKIYFGFVSEELALRIKQETGIDVNKYNCTLRASEVRKILKDHGNEDTESLRGQRAITEDDFVMIPQIIQEPDQIILSDELFEGKPVINFVKTINGKTTIAAYVSAKHLDLTVQTMYSGKNKGNLSIAAGEQAPANTPEANAGTVSNDIIGEKPPNVNSSISDSGENYSDSPENDSSDSGELHQDRDMVTFGGIDTEKGKHLDKAQQDEIKDIGEKIGQEVVFEDFYKLEKFKGKKKVPDGFLGADGKVHINYYAKRPVQFLLKHEITHYLKRNLSDFAYQDFMGFVLKSKAFTNWMHSKGFASMTDLKKDVYERYSEVKNFNEEKCYDEILADFVGDYLFGGKNTVSQKLINALGPKQKKTFMETIKDIIAYIKGIFSEKARQKRLLQKEISDLEDRFIQLYNEAVAAPAKENVNRQDEFAIFNHRGNLIEVDWDTDNSSSLSEQLKNHLDEVNEMQPVANIHFKPTDGKKLYNQVVEEYKKIGFKVDVQNFGTVYISEDEVRHAINGYINNDAEAAALLSIPKVLKRGKIISGHQNHKNRNYPTITFAAPVELNGKVGNVAVAVKVTGKTRYNAHRVLMPDGTEFVLDNEKDIEPQFARVTNHKEGQRSAKDSMSDIRLTQNNPYVKNNISEEGEDYSIPATSSPEELLEAYENGEISRQEYLDALKKENTLNPVEIANLTKEDANTTPKLKKKTGVSDGDKESKFYSSVLESDIFDLNFKAEVATDTFIEKYKSVTNKETLKKAAKELDEGGRSYVSKWWATDPAHASLIDTAVGFILMDRYQRIGDYDSAVAVTEKVREFGTAGGQQVQIFSILGRLSPETMAIYAQREMEKMFEAYADSHTKKWCDKNADKFKLTEDEIAIIRLKTLQATKLPEGRDKAIRLAEIASILQDKLPPQKGQGVRALQRISMLLNPKTNIRNITGNGIMVPVFIFSDFFGSGIDKVVSKTLKTNVRTTGNFDIRSIKGLKKGTYESMDDFRRHINTRNENLDRFEVGEGKSFNENGEGLFKTGVLREQLNDCAKVLNAIDRFTSFCLEMGDRPFYEMWFINSINNQKKLNNVEVETPEMIAIASVEALQRTWQDSNKVVKAVAGSKQILNNFNIGGYGLGDVMIKFTKTPANLTKAIFDFSPAGIVKSIAVDGRKMYQAIQKGKFEARMQKQFVDSLSKGIAGSMMYLLMAALFSAGRLTGDGDEDKDVANFERYIQGVPEYSFKLFGKWWSYEWMQPVGAMAAIISDFMQGKEKNPDSTLGDDILEAIRTGGDVLYNQSFMQSLQYLFTADNIIDGVIEAIIDDPSVYVPQLFSQIANATDDYRRVSYEKGKPLQNTINSVKVKLPFLRETLPKQVDVFGREVKNSQKNIFNAFLNPANTFTDTSNDVTDQLYALYEQTKDKTIMPRVAPYSFEVKNNKINFTAEERMEIQAATGKRSSELLKVLFESKDYAKLSDVQKIKVINRIYDYSTARAKSELGYDYATLSAMKGTDKNGKSILSEEQYKKLPEDAKEMIAQDYFLSKTEMRWLDNYKMLINYYIRQAKE